MASGGSWSIYWYNGVLVNSEISRGLDILQLEPSPYLTANEIAASRTVELQQFNPQGQLQYSWPASYALAHAYLDQISRDRALSAEEITMARQHLNESESRSGNRRGRMLTELADRIESLTDGGSEKVVSFTETVRELATM
jgi:hypothetical protein